MSPAVSSKLYHSVSVVECVDVVGRKEHALPGTRFLIEHQVPSIRYVLHANILVLQCVAFFLND